MSKRRRKCISNNMGTDSLKSSPNAYILNKLNQSFVRVQDLEVPFLDLLKGAGNNALRQAWVFNHCGFGV